MEGSPLKDGYQPKLLSASFPSTEDIDQQVNDLQERCAKLEEHLSTITQSHDLIAKELKHLKQTNAQLNEQLLHAQRAHEAAIKVQSHFLDNMSHELRTPLNGILGMAQLMHSFPLQKELKDYTDAILESGRHLEGILGNLLDYAKLSEGDAQPHFASFNLLATVEDTISNLAHKALEKGVHVVLNAPRNAHGRIETDQMRLVKTLGLLLENAITFTSKGTVSVLVNVDHQAIPPQLTLDVVDSGPGIHEADIPHVFEPFWQADGSKTRSYGGLGLGLTLSKQMVDLIGGQITVASTGVASAGIEHQEAERIPTNSTKDAAKVTGAYRTKRNSTDRNGTKRNGTTMRVVLPLHAADLPVAPTKPIFSSLRIGLVDVGNPQSEALTTFLKDWQITPVSTTSSDFLVHGDFIPDVFITSVDNPNLRNINKAIEAFAPHQNSPLVMGIVNPSIPPPSHVKANFDILIEMPVFHAGLQSALAFAYDIWKNRHPQPVQVASVNQPAAVLLVESNKINRKILMHMLQALALDPVFVDWPDIEQIVQKEKTYAALLFYIADLPPENIQRLLELTRNKILQDSSNIIGISNKSHLEPAEANAYAGVNKFLGLPTSIDVLRTMILGDA